MTKAGVALGQPDFIPVDLLTGNYYTQQSASIPVDTPTQRIAKGSKARSGMLRQSQMTKRNKKDYKGEHGR